MPRAELRIRRLGIRVPPSALNSQRRAGTPMPAVFDERNMIEDQFELPARCSVIPTLWPADVQDRTLVQRTLRLGRS
jgi:hypothetical protein